ncbi:hypothetical protein N7509_007861 [Penicillium cosmopolitanum]|uniref:DAGKc domain-containing protein n=1 Tax=Penicillium cosmopolitanum TaxID=1131564 RepID=A0A9W9VZV1_9EURO|nr:uncharacterized protein N7509_007861 [Penicillium cosmopolitanum]KAJ5392371.1 hypothetical protein N7509_007861 [Penicillium cosmopolitanum]
MSSKHSAEADTVSVEGNILKWTSGADEGQVELDYIVCVVSSPNTGLQGQGHRILFLKSKEDQTQDQDQENTPMHLGKIDISTPLPPALAPFQTEIPSHLKSQQSAEPIQVVISTKSGTGTAKSIFNDLVQPLLEGLGLTYQSHETQSAQSIISLSEKQSDNLKESTANGGVQRMAVPNIALIPCGTGNAMASSIGLRSGPASSLKALLKGKPVSLPVFAARVSPGSMIITEEGSGRASIPTAPAPIDTNVSDAGAGNVSQQVMYGAVVASWGLHAALVADSDTTAYRKFGSERFKMAAQELLHPSDGSESHRFRGRITITTRTDSSESTNGIQLRQRILSDQEHMYVLATLVPRLEKEFLISPDSEALGGKMQFLRFGPMAPEDAMRLMTLAYQGGQHVREESVMYQQVERVRIDFHEDEERWRRLCIDGKIVAVEKDGWMELSSQTPDQGAIPTRAESASRYQTLTGWRQTPTEDISGSEMLLAHQTGSVRVGEIARYTFTYTPASDPILPIPSDIYVRVKNTSAIPLRAAYLHGPYTLYTACYPSKFDPNSKYTEQDFEGSPQFEPYLKAGGNWDATIKIPAHFGDSHALSVGQTAPGQDDSVTWVIEIVSQVIFSNSAVVHFDLLIGRDAKSMEFFSSSGSSTASLGPPGKFNELWGPGTRGQQMIATKGIFSQAVTLRVDDTASLWNSPPLPSVPSQPTEAETDEVGDITSNLEQLEVTAPETSKPASKPASKPPKKKIHLVVLTHGLHSNLGADMLYLKESIDAAMNKSQQQKQKDTGVSEGDAEQVIVRGFSGNAVRTERGIQYLGKRLAKYILLMTYPDQPYFPLKGSKTKPFFSTRKDQTQAKPSLEPHSLPETRDDSLYGEDHAYQITSISFVGHSLGGLIQTYAIAYIQKHSPEFFTRIQPINFIALATPFLGLSNENPMYVRFALDLGLVGRTGQDLGLSWTAPKVRSGWGAIIGGRGSDAGKDQSQPSDPGAKPLLRILPCGPAHEVLKKFHHRTLYSNVVNDGIVPLRTSCLLFLDWRGLDRVEKARRGNGIVGTMAEWGWAELTGANSKSSPKLARSAEMPELAGGDGASALQGREAIAVNSENSAPSAEQFLVQHRPPSHHSSAHDSASASASAHTSENNSGPLSSFLSLFRTKDTKSTPNVKHSTPSGKHAKIYKRSQTLGSFDTEESPSPSAVRGNSLYEEDAGVYTPPKTTFFESAGDLLMPPLPPSEFILRPRRTVSNYFPRSSKTVPPSSSSLGTPSQQQQQQQPQTGESGLKVEEKIARAYHRDLTWRKVLVRLEPDAHNNIIVRRMFTNAYGWPVVKHLVDTHFGPASISEDDTLNRDSDRAKSLNVGPTSSGDEVEGQCDKSKTSTKAKTGERDSAGTPLQAVTETETHQGETQGNNQGDDLTPTCERCESEALQGPGPAGNGNDFDTSSHKTASTHGHGHGHERAHSHYTDVSRQDSARWTDRQVDEDDDCESGLDEDDEDAGYRWSPALRPA